MKIFGSSEYRISNNFTEHPLFKKYNITRTSDVTEADVIMEPTMKHILKYIHLDKKFLIWTCEPYWDRHQEKVVTVKGKKVHIMNCYTGDVYMNNFFYFTYIADNPFGTNFIKKFVPKTVLRRRIVALMTCDLSKKCKNTLRGLRTRIALDGHKKGIMDIWGQDWPNGISKGDSRSTFWIDKQIILKNYDFCLAFENINVKYYVTEKIWHAIANFTLPIYYGNEWIYQTFPQNSFIDYTKFKSNDELFDFINNMSVEEYNQRLQKCINVVKSNMNYQSHNICHAKKYEAFVHNIIQFDRIV